MDNGVVGSRSGVRSNGLGFLLGECIDGDGSSRETTTSNVGLGDSDDGDQSVLRGGDGCIGGGLGGWSGSDAAQKGSASQSNDSEVGESQHFCFLVASSLGEGGFVKC